MFGPFEEDESEPLDELIATVQQAMIDMKPYADDYPEMLSYLERLMTLKGKKIRERVSSDTLALIAGNFALGLLVVAYEQKHVILSKAFPQFVKPKMF